MDETYVISEEQGFLPDSLGSAVGCSLEIREEGCCSLNVCDETVLSLQPGKFGDWYSSVISVQSREDVVMPLGPFCCVFTLTFLDKQRPAGLTFKEMSV